MTCQFCGSAHTSNTDIPEIYFNHRKFSWNKCKSCSLLFILPYLSESDMQILYGLQYHEKYYFSEIEDYAIQIKLLKKYAGKKVLDFGCGDAGFLKQLCKYGYQGTGVEYKAELVQKLSNTHDEITFLTADDFWKDDSAKYDVIHLGDVLEHMNEPVAVINRLKGKLTDTGIFFIEGPLETNFNAAFFFRKCTTAFKKKINIDKIRVKEPYHVCFANANNQQILFTNSGLEKIYFKVWEHGWPYIDSFKSIKSPWLFAQWMIVKISMAISSLIPNWGNRFFYIGKPIIK